MEKAKNDHKVKRDNRTDYYSQGCAFSVIGLMFLLLTIFTSYATFNVLPLRWLFYYGSLVASMGLIGFTILLASAWRNLGIPIKYIVITAVLTICAFPLYFRALLGIGAVGSWFFALPYIGILQKIPVLIFPILVIAILFVAVALAVKSITIPRNLMKMATYLIIYFTIAYSWGHAIKFELDWYDEGLEIGDKTYHTIIYYGWLGDPGLVYLYECNSGYFGCDLIYETPEYDMYDADETSLVYDEAMGVLRIEYTMSEYTAQYSNIPPILYEHPIR